MRLLALAILLVPALAVAHPPPPPPPELAYEPERPVVEWSTWFRLGYGIAHVPSETVARATEPTVAAIEKQRTVDAALGFELSLPLTHAGNLRIGPWFEFRGFSEHPVVGGEVVLTAVPRTIDMFLYKGQGILALRGGGNDRVATGSLAYGYLAPWDLFDAHGGGASRYMIGVRLVATVTRALDDPRVWSATAGLEVEPFGAIRYLLGIRSWYR